MFSKTYLKQPAGQAQDSERLRNRLARCAWDQTKSRNGVCEEFAASVEQETGARVPVGPGGYDVGRFFRESDMRDLLDAVTCMADAFLSEGFPASSEKWVGFCKRVFAEEGMAYRIDDNGEAHYVVDAAFQEIADSVIAALSQAPYAAAGACANKAIEELNKASPEGKHAIRDIFEGVETAFKVKTGTGKDLTAANIAATLGPVVERCFPSADPVAQGAAQQTLESLKDWTNACHKYRHGHNAEEPVEPPLELTVVLVGNGLNFARWIAALGA